MKTALFSFPDDKIRDRFFRILRSVSDNLVQPSGVPATDADAATAIANGTIIKETLRSVKLDPPLKAAHERVVALFVSGRKMLEGTLAELQKRFQQEVDSHKASVELKELKDGEWETIRSRKLQRQQTS